MANAYEEVIRLTAHDETGPGVRSATSALNRLKSLTTLPLRIVDMVTAPLRSVWNLMQQIGLAAMGIQAIVGAVKQLTTPAIEFEHAFMRIQALTTSTTEDMAIYKKGIDEVARLTGRTDVELANAVFFIASAGQRGADAINTLTASAKASAAGLGDTKVVADAVTSALNAYKLSSTEATHVTDILTNAVVQGKMEPAALAGSLGRVLPMAAAAGVSFEQVAASMATMTRVGLDADEAATSLRGTLNALEKPGTAAKDALDSIGLSADQVRQSIREKGLLATLGLLMDRTNGNIDVLGEIIPNVRALTGVLATAGSQSEAYAEILASMDNAAGKTDSAFAIMSGTTQYWIDVLGVAWEQFRESLGRIILPILVPAMQSFAKWMQVGEDIVLAFTDDAGAMGLALTRVGDNFDETTKRGVQPFFQWIMDSIPKLKDFSKWIGNAFADIKRGDISNAIRDVNIALFELTGIDISAVSDKLAGFVDWIGPKLRGAVAWFTGTGWPMLQKAWEAVGSFVVVELVPKLVAIYDWVYPKVEEAINWAITTGWPSLQKMWAGMQGPKALTDIADDLERAKNAFAAFNPAIENLRATWDNLQKLDANWLMVAIGPLLPILLPVKIGLDNLNTVIGVIGGAAELTTAAVRKFTDLLVWFKDQSPAIGGAFSALGTTIHNIAVDITEILAKLPKLPGFENTGPQFVLPEQQPVLTSPAGAAAADARSRVRNATAPGGGPLDLMPPVSRAGGGWINEPVVGVGMRTGRKWSFAERRAEYVSAGGGGPMIVVQAGAVQISGAAGPSQGWADAADGLWADLHRRLVQSLEAQGGL